MEYRQVVKRSGTPVEKGEMRSEKGEVRREK